MMMRRWSLAATVVFLFTVAPMGAFRANETPTEVVEPRADQQITARQLHQAALERYRTSGDPHAIAQLHQALALYRAAGDRTGEATLLLDLSEISLLYYTSDESLIWAQKSLDLAQALENDPIAARALVYIGDYYLWREQPEQAQAAYQQSLEIAQAAGDRLGEGLALVGLGVLAQLEQPEQTAPPTIQQGLALIRAAGSARDEGVTLLKVAYFYGSESPVALAFLQQSLTPLQTSGDAVYFWRALESLGRERYDPENGQPVFRAELQQQLAIAQANDAALFEVILLDYLGHVALDQEDDSAALNYYQQALSRAEEINHTLMRLSLLETLGDFYNWRDDPHPALDYYEQGFGVARAAGLRDRANYFLKRIGRLNWLGDSQQRTRRTVEYFQAQLPGFLAAGDLESIIESTEIISTQVAREPAPEAFAYLQQALEIVRAQGQSEQAAGILGRLGLMYQWQLQFETAADRYKAALAIYQATENRAKEIWILTRLAEIYDDHFEPLDAQKAIDFYQQALDLYRTFDIPDQDLNGEGNMLGNIARLHQQQGDFPTALRYYQQQLEFYENDDKNDQQARFWVMGSYIAAVLTDIAELYEAQGDDDTAIDYYNQSIEREQNDPEHYRSENIAYELSKIAVLYVEQENLEAALNAYEEQIDVLQASGNQRAIADLFIHLSRVFQEQQLKQPQQSGAQQQPDRLTPALIQLYQQGLERLGAADDPWAIAQLLGGLGEIHYRQGQYEQALDFYQRKLAIHEQIDSLQELSNATAITNTRNRIADIYRQQGQTEAAQEILDGLSHP